MTDVLCRCPFLEIIFASDDWYKYSARCSHAKRIVVNNKCCFRGLHVASFITDSENKYRIQIVRNMSIIVVNVLSSTGTICVIMKSIFSGDQPPNRNQIGAYHDNDERSSQTAKEERAGTGDMAPVQVVRLNLYK